eukprot:COSAG06_NODE_809_length_12164_cov_17.936179_8_plen_72_part_00
MSEFLVEIYSTTRWSRTVLLFLVSIWCKKGHFEPTVRHLFGQRGQRAKDGRAACRAGGLLRFVKDESLAAH